MKKLNSAGVIRLLKRGDDYVLKTFYMGGTVYCEGDDIGDCSQHVVNNLLANNRIEFIGNCSICPADRYYKLKALPLPQERRHCDHCGTSWRGPEQCPECFST